MKFREVIHQCLVQNQHYIAMKSKNTIHPSNLKILSVVKISQIFKCHPSKSKLFRYNHVNISK